jgi:RimJ/RimL family protein N-acetyltransferase
MDEPFVDSKCPYCSQLLSFPRAFIGSLQECPNCPELVIVPEEGVELGGKLPIPIQTTRLLLRRFREADAEDFAELMPNEASIQYTRNEPVDVEQAQDWLEREKGILITHLGGSLSLAVELAGKPRVIGFVRIYFTDEARKQIGFTVLIGPAERRQGFGTEAAFAVMAFAFDGLKLHRVVGSCDSRNVAARGMLEKIGMRREGEGVESHSQKGEWVNETWYALLQREHAATPKFPF